MVMSHSHPFIFFFFRPPRRLPTRLPAGKILDKKHKIYYTIRTMVDVQRTAQLAHAAAAAAVRSERVCRSGHWPAIRRTQAAGQHEVGRLQGPSHGCSYRGREAAIVPAAEMPSDSSEQRRHHPFSDNCLGTVSPAGSRKQRSCRSSGAKDKEGSRTVGS